MKILHKYVLKEHLGPLIFSLATMTSLLMLNYIAKQLGNLVGKGLPWTAILEFILLSIPFTLALTFPMAVLMATLYAFGRLAAENEITALKASGVSLRNIMAPVLWAAVGATLFMVIFNDQVMPRTNHRLAVLQSDIAQTKPTFALREQVINEVQPGRLYLRASRIDEATNRMYQVTIYDMSSTARRRTIYADSGDLVMTKNGLDLLLTLRNGWMLEVPTVGPTQLQRIFFETDHIVVRDVGSQFATSEGVQTKFEREMTVCEMNGVVSTQWQRYEDLRLTFRQNVDQALAKKLEVSPGAQAFDPKPAPKHTLGSVYCALLNKLKVPAANAQTPNAQIPAPDSTATIVSESVPPAIQDPHDAMIQPEEQANIDYGMIESQRSSIQESLARIATYNIEIHKKFALAVACFVFVLLGAPIALRFPRGGVGLTIGASLFVFALYYIGLIGGSALAERRIIPAWIAMWMANVLFAIVALFLLKKMAREGSTARGGDVGELWDMVRSALRIGRKTT